MTTPSTPTVPAGTAVAAKAAAVAPAMFAALFGLFLLWGVGFLPLSAFHNAAHDTRHSNAFPCH